MISFSLLKRLVRKPKLPKWSIVIDPGHGGRHPGAVNKKYGYMECNINLHVAKYMGEHIREHIPKLVPFFTRSIDTTISLPERCMHANETIRVQGGPGVFISIHTNARCLKGRYGLEIETFHFRGSEEGRKLAGFIQDKLLYGSDEYYDVPVIDRGVKIGQRRGKDGELKDFYVLRETNMTAVLVELGFLSDDEEAQLLIKPENQKIMAKAIVNGVVDYLKNKEK